MPRTKVLFGLAVWAVMCTEMHTASANGYRNPPDGATGMGRTGGKITDVSDVSAIAQNPANLAGLKGAQVQVGATVIDSEATFTGADGRTSKTDGGMSVLPSAFGAVPVGGHPVVLGVGLTTPWGQSTEWSPSSAVAQTAPYRAQLTTANVNPSLATKLGDHVLVGAGLDVLFAELELRQNIMLAPGVPVTGMTLKGDGTGVGGNVGVTVELPRQQRVSATYRSPVKADLDGDMDVSGFPGPLAASSDFSSEMTFPSSVVAGYGISVTPAVRLAAEVEWIEFSQFDSLPLDLGANGAVGPFPPAIPQDWKNVWTYGLGAEWAVNDAWVARAGGVYLESPIPETTLAPTLPDDDRLVYSAGLGYHAGAHAIDLAYAYSEYKRDVNNNINPAYVGQYDVSVHLMQASYTHTF